MATKLKNLRIRKVDFVDEGANPEAHIRMLKRKDGEEKPAEESGRKESGNMLKKLLHFIGKAAGMDPSEIDSAVDEIQKDTAGSFREKITEANNRKIADEMWDVCYALQSSLCSILNDEEKNGANAAAAMQESLEEFYAVVQETIPEWAGGGTAGIVRKKGAVSDSERERIKEIVKRLNESIESAGEGTTSKEKSKEDRFNQKKDQKGDIKEMKIDKSKLTDAERAFLESIEKRYGTEDEAAPDGTRSAPASVPAASVPGPMPISPSAAATGSAAQPAVGTRQGAAPASQEEEADSIYKGLHPAVKAELEGLKKFREEAEARELTEIAKKYVIIGKKEEELIPLFQSLRAAGGTAYQDMIAVLDQAVDTVEKSGAFSEIGRSGHGSPHGGAWAEAEAEASKLMKSKGGLSKAQALDEVLLANPELAARCEKEG